MPRKPSPPRLYWRDRKDGTGRWEIRDGATRISTGTASRSKAEATFAAYLQDKFRPSGPSAAEGFKISTALTIYAREHAINVADPSRIAYAIEALDNFWRDLRVIDIKGETC